MAMLSGELADTPGHPPGVAPGSTFVTREGLAAARVHLQQMHAVAVRRPAAAAQAAPEVGPGRFVVATSLLVCGDAVRVTVGGLTSVEFRVPYEVEPSLVCPPP